MRNKVKTCSHRPNKTSSIYYHCLFSAVTTENKQFWKIVKLVSRQQRLVQMLSRDKTRATTNGDKSNMLNSKCWNYLEPPLCDPPRSESMHHENYPDDLLCTTDEIKWCSSSKDLIRQRLTVLNVFL